MRCIYSFDNNYPIRTKTHLYPVWSYLRVSSTENGFWNIWILLLHHPDKEANHLVSHMRLINTPWDNNNTRIYHFQSIFQLEETKFQENIRLEVKKICKNTWISTVMLWSRYRALGPRTWFSWFFPWLSWSHTNFRPRMTAFLGQEGVESPGAQQSFVEGMKMRFFE